MTVSVKANAAGTQGEILLNGTPVQTFTQNTLQVSGQVLVAGAQSNEYHSLTRKDYVDGLINRLQILARIGLSYPEETLIAVNNRQVVPMMGNYSEIDPDNLADPALLKITPKVAGYYHVYERFTAGVGGASFLEAVPFKNGAPLSGGLTTINGDVSYLQAQAGSIVFMNGTTDYLQPGVRINKVANAGTVNLQDGSVEFIVTFVRP